MSYLWIFKFLTNKASISGAFRRAMLQRSSTQIWRFFLNKILTWSWGEKHVQSQILFRHQKETDDSTWTQLFTFSSFHKFKCYSTKHHGEKKFHCWRRGVMTAILTVKVMEILYTSQLLSLNSALTALFLFYLLTWLTCNIRNQLSPVIFTLFFIVQSF